jgi:hypothetical protein
MVLLLYDAFAAWGKPVFVIGAITDAITES